MILTETQRSQLLRAASDVAGALAAATVHLAKSDVAVSADTLLADLTAAECDYTGYAAGVLAWDAASVADDDTVEVTSTALVFRPTDAVNPQGAYVLWIQSAGGGTPLLLLGRFDGAPLPMESALDQIAVTIRYRPATQSMVAVVS